MDPVLYGYMLYGISLLTVGGMYAILALGLNVQWGFTGLFNAGIAGFFGIGAYTAAIRHGAHIFCKLPLRYAFDLYISRFASGMA